MTLNAALCAFKEAVAEEEFTNRPETEILGPVSHVSLEQLELIATATEGEESQVRGNDEYMDYIEALCPEQRAYAAECVLQWLTDKIATAERLLSAIDEVE